MRSLALMIAVVIAAAGAFAATLLAQNTALITVSIIEPELKPPPTWAYEPKAVTVKIATKVTWVNTGAVVHTVTADDGKSFDSGNMQPKASFSFTAKEAGTFAYHCRLHPWMKGTLIVQP